MPEEVSLARLYLLRCIYLLEAFMLGSSVWPGLVKHLGWADPLQGVAPSFWGHCRYWHSWEFGTR
jgi:hypothetical protein